MPPQRRCNTPLVRSRQGALYCVGCQMEVRRDVSPTAALSPAAEPAVSPSSPRDTDHRTLLAAQQQRRRDAAHAPTVVPSVKRMLSPAADAAAKLPRIERAAAADPGTAADPGLGVAALPASPSPHSAPQAAAPGGGELQMAPVVRAIMQTLLAKMLQVGSRTRM